MTVMTPRESWTDERLDDFRREVIRRFDETNQRIEAGFARTDARFDAIDARFDALMRALFTVGFVLAAGLLGVIAALIA